MMSSMNLLQPFGFSRQAEDTIVHKGHRFSKPRPPNRLIVDNTSLGSYIFDQKHEPRKSDACLKRKTSHSKLVPLFR